MKPYTITIDQLRRHNPDSVCCYRDCLLITDHVEAVERFSSPCRIDAVTVLVCTGGYVDCRVNLRQYAIGPDMLFVNLPEDILQITHVDGLEAYAVVISAKFLSELAIDIHRRSDFFLAVRQNAACPVAHAAVTAMKPYYTLLSNNILTQSAETTDIIHGLTRAFAYTLLSLARKHTKETLTRQNTATARGEQLFDKFMSLVKAHHTQQRSVRFYASKMCLTPNYMSGIIKAYTGKSASEWIDEYVILEAKIMLRDTELNIQQIAYRLNFPNQSSFGKYFKQHVGTGPRQYRHRELNR